MVAKIDDEIYVLSIIKDVRELGIIKTCSHFSFVFSAVPENVELLKISKVM